jgi:hypothetical protein
VSTPINSLPEKLRLLDRAGELVRWVTAAEAVEMIDAERVEVLRTRRRIRAIRFRMEEPDMSSKRFEIRRESFGDAHRFETDDNPRGVWTLDRVRPSQRKIFTRVLDDVLKAA